MNFGTAKKLPYNREDRDSIFHRVNCEEGETLSNIIKALGWGNNKRIKTGGFSISHCEEIEKGADIDHPDYEAIGKLKYNNTKDPYFKFEKGRTYICPKKRNTISVIITKENYHGA